MMKKITGLLLLVLFLFFGCQPESDTLTVMTFNVRFDNPDDGPNAWNERKEWVVELVNREKPDVVGFQEVLFHQLEDLRELLPEYSSYGVGRNDGQKKGEAVPIFYRHNRLEMIQGQTFWLSESPDVPGSKSWGAALPRIASWVELRLKEEGLLFYVFNTHFSHSSVEAQMESAQLLLDRMTILGQEVPIVLTGDLNMLSSSKGYQLLISPWKDFRAFQDAETISLSSPEGGKQTYNRWGKESGDVKVDYIMISGGRVESHRILPERKGVLFVSDHYPVVSEVVLFHKPQRVVVDGPEMKRRTWAPRFLNVKRAFQDSILIQLDCSDHDAVIHYTTDRSEPNISSPVYKGPFPIYKSTQVKARSLHEKKDPSKIVQIHFSRALIKEPNGSFPKITLSRKPQGKYQAKGAETLMDGVFSLEGFWDGRCLGFQGGAPVITIDLGRLVALERMSLSTLHDPASWVFHPSRVIWEIAGSDGRFKKIGEGFPDFQGQKGPVPFAIERIPKECQKIRIEVVHQRSFEGPWQSLKPEETWTFIDEVCLEPVEKE